MASICVFIFKEPQVSGSENGALFSRVPQRKNPLAASLTSTPPQAQTESPVPEIKIKCFVEYTVWDFWW